MVVVVPEICLDQKSKIDGNGTGNTDLWPISTSIPRNVPHDLYEIFRILDDDDVREHLEEVEIRGNAGCNASKRWEATGTAL